MITGDRKTKHSQHKMANLSTNAAVNQIAENLSGASTKLSTNGALNLINDVIAKAASGSLPGQIFEDFFFQQGDTMMFSASSLNGGNSANVSAVPSFNGTNMNDAVTLYPRRGLQQLNLSNASANAFASLQQSNAVNALRYILLTSDKFYIDAVWRMSATANINFANDPVLACVGLLSYNSTATVNPLVGTYFRLSRTSETSTVKYVVRVAGVETVFSTGLGIISNNTGYIKTGMMWDGAADTMTYYATDGTTVHTNVITAFLATYPAFVGTNLHFCGYMSRNGDGASKQVTTMQIDSASRWTSQNYNAF